MKFFIFIVLIPMTTGVITAANGASYFNTDELHLALMINIPICVLSSLLHSNIK
jgi:hypothetical protein